MNIPRKKADTIAINMRLPRSMIEAIDLAMKIGQGSSRSDIIKTAIANYLKELTVITEMKKRKLK